MTQDSRSALFVGALIGSGAGFLLLILTDFGGWYNYYYYAGYQESGYVGVSNPVTLLGMIVLGLPFLYCAAISLKGATSPNSLAPRTVSIAFYLSVTEVILVFVGAAIFVAAVSGSDSWWLGAGFYGSAIGGILAVVCLFAARRVTRSAAPPSPQYPQVAPPVAMQFQTQPYQPAHPQPPQAGYQVGGTQGAYQPIYQRPVAPGSTMHPAPVQPGPRPLVQSSPQFPASMKFCPRCGTQVAGGRFCPQCGSPLQ